MEFAIGTLVTIILGVVIVGFGIVFVWNIVSQGEQVSTALTSSQERELEAMLASGKLVATTPQQRTIRAGETGTFGVAVLNRLDAETTFRIEVIGYDAAQRPVPSTWSVRYFPDLVVGVNQDAKALVAVTPAQDAPKGTYTFVVTVRDMAGVYDSPRIFTVNVP